ncbi:helix-turn-helix transcriptional regulator [Dactylosporangium sp. NPDC051541]|uniref:helix-turn-helix transcriptional regulator n=1 Tax=Dactylosporangium sp. NPDC051541 TaxID=3363977 RepID=UPI00378B8CC5
MAGRRYRLIERRKAVGLSQERLAEIVGVDRSTVVRWERADTTPQPWHRPRLADALKVSIDELAELVADVGEPPARLDDRLGYVLRHPRRVDLVTVAYLREQVQRFDELYESTPSTLPLASVGQLHGQVTFLRRHASGGAVQRELAAATAESATLMGQLVWDASQRRDHAVAGAYFDQAVTAAQQVPDAVVEANALLRKSYIALYGSANPAAGLALADRAAIRSERQSHVITSLARLHVGEAHAMLGDVRQCEAALGCAAHHIGHVEPNDPAAVLFCPSQYGRLAGSCWLFLGRPQRAEEVLESTRQYLTQQRKSTAIVLGNLALAATQQGQIETATARLHEAIDVCERTRGGGGLNVVFGAARELRPWRREPIVEEVTDRLLSLMTTA